MSSLMIAAVQPGELRSLLDRAADTLAGAATAAEILDARDQAAFVYDAAKAAARLARAKGAHDDVVARVYRAQADALEIESLAKRRLADEYDAAQDRGEVAGHGGNRGNQHTAKVEDENVGDSVPDRPATAADAGISRGEVFEARKIRDAIERDPGIVRRVLNDILDAGDEPTKAKLRKQLAGPIAKVRSAAQAEKTERRHEREVTLAGKIKALPDKKYGVILADPEWRFEPYSRESGMDRSPDNHYPTSSTDDICARDVASIAADDSVCFVYGTAPMLVDCLRSLESWGFVYKTHAIWHKIRPGKGRGTGYWFTGEHELLLVGVKGNVPAPAMGTQFGSVFAAPIGEHSAKPDCILEMIEAYFPNLPKIELNRRGPARPGWDAWGLEADEEVEPEANVDVGIQIDIDSDLYDRARSVIAGMDDDLSGRLVRTARLSGDLGIDWNIAVEIVKRIEASEESQEISRLGNPSECLSDLGQSEAASKKKTKPKKLAPYEEWQAASRARRKAYRGTIPASISDEDLVLAAKSNLIAYDRAVRCGNEADMVTAGDKIGAIGDHLFGLDPDHQWSGPGGPPKGNGRFDCLVDAKSWLIQHLAAAAGVVPMFGQPGRFMIDVAGCRVDFRYAGLFEFTGGDAHVVDLDRSFISETGYRNFQVCPSDFIIVAGDLDCKGWLERACTAQLSEGSGKKPIKLHNPPFGLSGSQNGKKVARSDEYIVERRKSDPAWGPGGYLHALISSESEAA